MRAASLPACGGYPCSAARVKRGPWSERGRVEWHCFREHGPVASSPRGLSATALRHQDYGTDRDCHVHAQDPHQDPVAQRFLGRSLVVNPTGRAGHVLIHPGYSVALPATHTSCPRTSPSGGTACLLVLRHPLSCNREVSALAHDGHGAGPVCDTFVRRTHGRLPRGEYGRAPGGDSRR